MRDAIVYSPPFGRSHSASFGWILFLILALALASSAVGCGDSDDPEEEDECTLECFKGTGYNFCSGNTLVMELGEDRLDEENCRCVGVVSRVDCTENGQVCQEGACVDSEEEGSP